MIINYIPHWCVIIGNAIFQHEFIHSSYNEAWGDPIKRAQIKASMQNFYKIYKPLKGELYPKLVVFEFLIKKKKKTCKILFYQ